MHCCFVLNYYTTRGAPFFVVEYHSSASTSAWSPCFEESGVCVCVRWEFSLGPTNSACVLILQRKWYRRRAAPSRLLSAYGHLAAYLLWRMFRQQNNMFRVDSEDLKNMVV